MIDLAQFNKQHDVDKPDILFEMYRDGALRSACMENQFLMNTEELKEFKRRQIQHYTDEACLILMQIIKFKKPQFALLDEILMSFRNNCKKEQKLYVYFDFVKPGKHDFVINHSKVSVHRLIGGHRTEPLPKCKSY